MVARQPHDDEVREALLPIPARDRVGEQSCSGRVGNGQHEPGVVRGGDVFQAGDVGAAGARPGRVVVGIGHLAEVHHTVSVAVRGVPQVSTARIGEVISYRSGHVITLRVYVMVTRLV